MAPQIQNYMGPYEEWVFKNGRDYSFPLSRGGSNKRAEYLAALAQYDGNTDFLSHRVMAEGDGGNLVEATPVLPPIWTADGQRFMPFIFTNPKTDGSYPNVSAGYCDREDMAPRFKLNFALEPDCLHENFKASGSQSALATPRWSRKDRLKGKSLTIIGVIDDGIPFANRSFEDSTGASRIEYFWDQSAPADNSNAPSVPFGKEFSNDDIDALKARNSDEDALYREAGLVPAGLREMGKNLDRFATHGSIVLDVAAGSSGKSAKGKLEDLDDEVRVIAVQISNTSGWDTSGFGQDAFILSAFHYVFERAKRIAEAYFEGTGDAAELPLVTNFSYGFSGGAHDGSTELETALGDLVSARRKEAPTALVMPSGNLFENKMHGQIWAADFGDRSFKFQWNLQPNDRTPSFLELWFPEDTAAGDYKIRLSGPVKPLNAPGTNINNVTVSADAAKTGGDPRRVNLVHNHLGDPVGQISADKYGNNRWRVLVALGPSEPEKPELPKAEPGKWQIEIIAREGAPALTKPIQCWIQRDSDPLERGSGNRQSYLYDPIVEAQDPVPSPRIDHPDAFARRFGTLNGTGTDETVTLVAGYDAHTLKPADYSSAGPVNKNGSAVLGTKQVCVSAASERSPSLAGVPGAGTRSGSMSALSGTSVASPLIARKLAVAFATKSATQIKAAEADNYVSLLDGVQTVNDKYHRLARLDPKTV